jgi:hypothetical protein
VGELVARVGERRVDSAERARPRGATSRAGDVAHVRLDDRENGEQGARGTKQAYTRSRSFTDRE